MYSFAERFKYIVIEGAIGVGKTSLAHEIAPLIGAELVLENPAHNPFLTRYYETNGTNALATQLYFHFQRQDQLNKIAKRRKQTLLIGDYMFEKNSVFANLTLNKHEKALYKRICSEMPIVERPQPDLIIWLQASPSALLARIRQRGIEMERNINEDDLERLSQAYAHFFQTYEDACVFSINTEKFNPVQNQSHFSLLIERLNAFKGAREYFNPCV